MGAGAALGFRIYTSPLAFLAGIGVLMMLARSVGLTVVFGPLAIRAYMQRSSGGNGCRGVEWGWGCGWRCVRGSQRAARRAACSRARVRTASGERARPSAYARSNSSGTSAAFAVAWARSPST